MKSSIMLLLWLCFLLTLMQAQSVSEDSVDDDVDDDGSSPDGDDDVTITGNSGYYNADPSYNAQGSYYPYQNYGGGWKKSGWSGGWNKKSSSSSSSWGKGRGGGHGGRPPHHPPKCPFGLAQIWFGSLHNLPYGYQVCDGSNGTPDLTDRLVIGAGTQFPFATAGGAANIVLTEAQLAPHVHAAGSLMANPDGQHTHQVTTTVDGGAHEHHALHLTAANAGDHTHAIDLDTSVDGEHDHTFNAFNPVDYNTNPDHQDFALPVDAVDKHESYAQLVDSDGEHAHSVEGDTGNAGDHTHAITGSIGPDGEHTHDIDTATSADGIHSHPVVGNTGETGAGAPIYIMNPYHALYFICCGKEDYPPPGWKNSQYY